MTRHTYEACDGLAIITWNSGSPNSVMAFRGHTLGWFERCLAHFGVQHTVLGVQIGSAWTNRMKIDLTIDFLATSDRELVLVETRPTCSWLAIRARSSRASGVKRRRSRSTRRRTAGRRG